MKNLYSLWDMLKIIFNSAIKLLVLLNIKLKWTLNDCKVNLNVKNKRNKHALLNMIKINKSIISANDRYIVAIYCPSLPYSKWKARKTENVWSLYCYCSLCPSPPQVPHIDTSRQTPKNPTRLILPPVRALTHSYKFNLNQQTLKRTPTQWL